MNKIFTYLDEILGDAKCELNYTKDYELLIATMLSAQTTDKRVNEVTKNLFAKYDNLDKLSEANIEDIKTIIKPLGTFNKKALNIINISKSLKDIGYVPNDRTFLESLSGVGRKTTNVVLSELYNEPYIAVDTHVLRVSKRLGLINENDDVLDCEHKLRKLFKGYDYILLHHQFIHFGRYFCKAMFPKCENCKLKGFCRAVKD